jgi:hypothetical protein
MLRFALAAFIVVVASPCAPALAVTSKDKMAICKFGADDQNLNGKARAAFMKKCMSNKDDPRGAPLAPPPASPPPPPQH